jgi:hypothetical protein
MNPLGTWVFVSTGSESLFPLYYLLYVALVTTAGCADRKQKNKTMINSCNSIVRNNKPWLELRPSLVTYTSSFRLIDGTNQCHASPKRMVRFLPITTDDAESEDESISLYHDLDDIANPYNIAADCLFFLGSICFFVTASWNFYYSITDSLAATETEVADWVTILSILGPLIYFLNAIVEISLVASCVRCTSTNTIQSPASSNTSFQHSRAAERYLTNPQHDSSTVWDLISNIFFAIAAATDFAVVVHRQISSSLISTVESSFDLRLVSVYWYFFSGLTAVFGFKLSCSPTYRLLLGTGDVLFLIGCVIDVILVHVARKIAGNAEEIYSFLFVSSLLWLVNSILYIVADLMAHGKKNKIFGA